MLLHRFLIWIGAYSSSGEQLSKYQSQVASQEQNSLPKKLSSSLRLAELAFVIGCVVLLAFLLFPAVQAARESARKTQSALNLLQLGQALHLHQETYRSLPAGTQFTADLSPTRRIGLIAPLLPYLEHQSLHDRLKIDEPWDSSANSAAAETVILGLLRPSLSTETVFGGRAATHYVGMAGNGLESPLASKDSPIAGLFGFDRAYSLNELADGGSNTIAFIEVFKAGPWIAGGHSTVRGFSAKPFICGPDGFGAPELGYSQVVFADGHVSTLEADTDDAVIEQLATVSNAKMDER